MTGVDGAQLPGPLRNVRALAPFIGPDGAQVQELAGHSTGMASHSLARITHPAGTASLEHFHRQMDEVYFVLEGCGRLRVDGAELPLEQGDFLVLHPGQRHKVWNDGPQDLVLLVTCAPAYTPDDVVWLE